VSGGRERGSVEESGRIDHGGRDLGRHTASRGRRGRGGGGVIASESLQVGTRETPNQVEGLEDNKFGVNNLQLITYP
jgi:hypothetical protein